MEEDRVNEQPKKPSLWEMTKLLFLCTNLPLRVPTYLEKAKALFNQVQAYFFPPNLDSRGSMGNIEVEPGSGGGSDGGAGEKVKEVVRESYGKGRDKVGDSAESAAKIEGISEKELFLTVIIIEKVKDLNLSSSLAIIQVKA
ncbi:hypothetical protein ACFX2C_046216 [Malus domestica]